MIACISPSILSIDETLNTLKYACRAKKIEKVVQLNVFEPRNVEDYRKEIVRLRTQIEALKDQQSLKEQ